MIRISINGFSVFGKFIPFYGILMVVGFAVAAFSALPRAKKRGFDGWEVVYSGMFAIMGGILGAKLLSILTSINLIIEYHISFIDVISNGFVFYGGLLGGAGGIWVYCKIYKYKVIDYLELFAPGVPLGHAFGRIGCLVSGCCYGMVTNGPFAVIYTSTRDLSTPLNVPLLPVQLIEAIALTAIYVVLEVLFYMRKEKYVSLLGYLYLYPICRFTLEFFRADAERGLFLGLSTSQWISLGLLAIAVTMTVLAVVRYVRRKNGTAGPTDGLADDSSAPAADSIGSESNSSVGSESAAEE